MYSNNSKQQEKGSMLFLAVMLMLVLLAIGLGVSEFIVVELRSLRGLGDSVFAFGAADAGVERGLYVDKVSCNAIEPDATTDLFNCVEAYAPTTTPETLPNNSKYLLELKPGTGDPVCPGDNYCVESKGRFQGPGSPEESIRKVQIAR
ncbi:MAG: hypothetical protein AAB524_02405 [Patescibacteria group bacterium]